MNEVRVNKDHLLDALKKNRERHVDTFEQVMEDYRLEAVRLLEEHIHRIENGAVAKVHVTLPAPENYEQEYDNAIAMVEWEESDTITLTAYDFNRYVLDQWEWRGKFDQTVATYSKA